MAAAKLARLAERIGTENFPLSRHSLFTNPAAGWLMQSTGKIADVAWLIMPGSEAAAPAG